jgi:hypothetical protein
MLEKLPNTETFDNFYNKLDPNMKRHIDQINWRLACVLVCNGVFITADYFTTAEKSNSAYYLSGVLLPVLAALLDRTYFDDKNLDVSLAGAYSAIINNELKKYGAPAWAGPALTLSLSATFTPLISAHILRTCEKIPKLNIFNFWHRDAKSTVKEPEIQEKQDRMPSKLKLG